MKKPPVASSTHLAPLPPHQHTHRRPPRPNLAALEPATLTCLPPTFSYAAIAQARALDEDAYNGDNSHSGSEVSTGDGDVDIVESASVAVERQSTAKPQAVLDAHAVAITEAMRKIPDFGYLVASFKKDDEGKWVG